MIRSETNLGVGGARNLGVGAGSAPYVLRARQRRSAAPRRSGSPGAARGRHDRVERRLLGSTAKRVMVAHRRCVGRCCEAEPHRRLRRRPGRAVRGGSSPPSRASCFAATPSTPSNALMLRRTSGPGVDFCLPSAQQAGGSSDFDGPVCDHPRGGRSERSGLAESAHAAFTRHWWRQRRRPAPQAVTVGGTAPALTA